jgi:hypothetical protein
MNSALPAIGLWFALLISNIIYAFIRRGVAPELSDDVPTNIAIALERSYFQGLAVLLTYLVLQ